MNPQDQNPIQQPVIDVDYIDKLLSSHPTKQEQPAPKTEDPVKTAPDTEEPAPEAAVPEKKGGKKPLLVLAVIALLGAGFLLGWLVKPAPKDSEDPTKSTPPTGTTDTPLTDSGIAPDYVAMSTPQLISIAVKINGLSYYGSPLSSTILTTDIYETMKRENPVLVELEQRPDAARQLQLFALSSSNLDNTMAANALLGYFVNQLGFGTGIFMPEPECQWVCQADNDVTVYEYTEAPEVYFAKVQSESYSGLATVFSFGTQDFLLQGKKEWPEGNNPNFWFRIEVHNQAMMDANPDPEPELIVSADDAWVTIQKYGENEGWFVYGYAPTQTRVFLRLLHSYAVSNVYILNLSASPLPETELYTPELALLLIDNADHILSIAQSDTDRDLSTYPLLAELLARDDGISCLLSIAQSYRFHLDDGESVLIASSVLALLELPCVQERMTTAQQLAVDLICEQGYFYAGSLAARPNINGDSIAFPSNAGYYLGDKPESLWDISDEKMDFWIHVPLSPGAQELVQTSWTLEAEFSGSGGTLGVWEWFDSSNNRLAGWLVSGKMEEAQTILLRLKQGGIVLELQEVFPIILEQSQ